jgi:hypothetical protein
VTVPAGPEARPLEAPWCLPAEARDAELESAWPNAGRVYFCLKDGARTCASVGPAGDYRGETSPSPKVAASRSRFELPKTHDRLDLALGRAKEGPWWSASILERKSGRVLQTNRFYDEKAAFEGWLGDALVIRTTVTDSFCALTLFDALMSYQPKGQWLGRYLGRCRYTSTVLQTGAQGYAFVDDESVAFVDATTMGVTHLAIAGTGSSFRWERATNETGADTWTSDDGKTLFVVFRAPPAGDVVRVDLHERKMLEPWSPPACGRRT